MRETTARTDQSNSSSRMCCHTPHTPGKENRRPFAQREPRERRKVPVRPRRASAAGGTAVTPTPAQLPGAQQTLRGRFSPDAPGSRKGGQGVRNPPGESCAWRHHPRPPSSHHGAGGPRASAAPAMLPRSAHASGSELMAAQRLLFVLGRRGGCARQAGAEAAVPSWYWRAEGP